MQWKAKHVATWLGLTLAGCQTLSNTAEVSQSPVQISNLRCEYLADPIGISVVKPRLEWRLQSSQRGVYQTAYQILVASSADRLAKDTGDLWDSGKVASDESNQIAYAGKPLTSRQTVYWKLRSWDANDNPTPWSTPAVWEMGLLDRFDWKAQWIEASPVQPKSTFTLRSASYEAIDGKGSKDVTATVAALVHDSVLNVKVDNNTLGGDPVPQHIKQLRIAYEADGQTREQVFAEGSAVHIPATPLPYLRKTFGVTKPVTRARLYATALGLYELHLNGQRVGDHILAPDWTDYRKRIQYQDYDVTTLLKTGDNALGALVANGWYSGHIGNGGNQFWGKTPALLAQLEITYADGTVDRVTSDDSWKQHASPIEATDFMLGEQYNAQAELPKWDQPALNDAEWSPVSVRHEKVDAPLEGQSMPAVKVLTELPAKTIKEPAPGRWTFDIGQNMVGVVRLKVNAPAGTVLTIRHAEMLQPDGTIYTTNLRGAPSIDTYVCRGGGEEVWQPHFTFHGFRYVEVTGLPAKPSLDALAGIVLGSATPPAGQFTCSDPRINQLQSNIQWGQRGNFLSVPTDCPQRDERLGWMGDAQVFIRTATYNADVASFFTKWLVDVDDAQMPDGRFTDVSPNTMQNPNGVPAWGDAGVICPWTIYQVYGDKRVLDCHFPAMAKWVDWCHEHSTNLIRDKDRGNDYGDWLSIGADTSKELIGTAYFAYSTHLTAKAAAAIGKTEEAAKYYELFEQIKAAFDAKYVKPDGHILGDTQTAYAMALKFDLLPDSLRSAAGQHLADAVRAKNNHLSTGFIGVSYLLPTLTQTGHADVAYNLLMQDTFPSWLFSVKNGATTIWERWDGWTPDKGFQDPGMNSFNHYSLGSCGEWLFDTVAGIAADPKQPGFKHFFIRPLPGGGLTFADASYESPYGKIVSRWEKQNGVLKLHVVVPPNSSATVVVPASKSIALTVNGEPIHSVPAVRMLGTYDDRVELEVGSGDYQFVGADNAHP